MRVWITSVLVVFGMVELYQWLKDFTLPLPVFILAGVLLAIASNYRKYAGWSFQSLAQSDTKPIQKPLRDGFTEAPNWSTINPSSAKILLPKPTHSISFTIRRHTPEEERCRENTENL